MKLFPILLSAYACTCSPNATTVRLFLAVANSHTIDIAVADAVAVAVAIMVKLGDHFPTIATAREAIRQFVLYNIKSYKTESSDKRHYAISCKNSSCKFGIRANLARKKNEAVITVFT